MSISSDMNIINKLNADAAKQDQLASNLASSPASVSLPKTPQQKVAAALDADYKAQSSITPPKKGK